MVASGPTARQRHRARQWHRGRGRRNSHPVCALVGAHVLAASADGQKRVAIEERNGSAGGCCLVRIFHVNALVQRVGRRAFCGSIILESCDETKDASQVSDRKRSPRMTLPLRIGMSATSRYGRDR